MIKRILAFVLTFALALVSASCTQNPVSRTEFLLDTVVTVTIYSPAKAEQLDKAFDVCKNLEKTLSRTVEGSDVWRANNAGGETVVLSDDTAFVLREAIRIYELTGGLFDVTIAPVSGLWDFHSEKPVPPDSADIAESLGFVGLDRLVLEGNELTMPEGFMLDLGGIAKGYIGDKMAEVLRENGVKSAILDLGGNIVTVGQKGRGDWNIGIQNPLGSGALLAVSAGKDWSIVTSGIYQRGFEFRNKWYHHILDPRNGYPVDNGLASVSISCQSSMTADAAATGAMLLGYEKGMELCNTLGVGAVFILIDGSYEIINVDLID